jgi:RNA polymerase sigma-70 factor (ECF subfamily)
LNELRLIKKIQRSGDRAAADELVRHYYDQIYVFVKKQLSQHDVALDLTQEIFISMLRTIHHYDKRKGAAFRTWLYRIASNKLADWFRSRAYRNMTETKPIDDVEAADDADFVQMLENSEFTERVCAFVGGLASDTQTIFRLHIFGGHTFLDISKILGMAEGSVKSRYYRLIQLLGKEFADYE